MGARALVTDIDDETNATIILSAKQLREDLRVIGVASSDEVEGYHQYTGADTTVRPRQALGEILVNKALTSISTQLQDTIEIGTELEITELLLEENSEIAG